MKKGFPIQAEQAIPPLLEMINKKSFMNKIEFIL